MNEPVWYRRNRDRSDRFARVVDSAETHDDHEFGDELAVVSALRELGSQPALDKSGRDRIFAAIEAKSATAVVGDTTDSAQETTTDSANEPVPTHTLRSPESPKHRQKRKASLLAAATAASIVAAGALGIELSQTAIPGDLLYDLKRTTESIALDLTFSDEGRARKHIEIASTRIDELTALVERDDADGGATADEATDYRTLLIDLDRSAIIASRVITDNAADNDDRGDLTMLRDWAMRSGDRLATLQPSIPDTVLNRFGQSTQLVRDIEDRTVALLGRAHCDAMVADASDIIGVLPATGQCDTAQDGREHVAVQPKASSESTKTEKSGQDAASPLPATTAPDLDPTGRTSDPENTGDDTADEPLTVPELPEPSLPGTDEEPVEESSEANSPGIPLLPELGIG
ncbi:DUF5667 domain-containing protein [Haloechinothrix halophila]|uniref:DUF5667 domain-containing protein n=1 Tax=Haloechinothrix halophila YIM 93223 TaxID=592678 RepID=W9DM73_9PSEU|nr:DUF5667 domain-containing protein [Haloechinothrix halophila]ETA66524.1 hypothetical protein AmyhaDRAFT_0283 [Haloechinothrix halophila YIM 93223]